MLYRVARTMDTPSFRTPELQDCLQRIRAGDRSARDELFRGLLARLERLASRMLRGFPRVARWADTGDVLQSSLVRLMRALEEIEPASVRSFLNLAAVKIRQELLDLLRHFHGPHGHGEHYRGTIAPEGAPEAFGEPAAPALEPGELEAWTHFHEAVERLPAEQREVVGLVFYHGWTQKEVAELFGVSDRTIRTWWQEALLQLRTELGDNLPT